MLFLQIRQAEVALDDGRLDEAYQLVQSPKVRNHRSGQALVTELVEKLLKRARAHLAGGRPMPALADCEKAQALGGNQDQAAALRNEIEQSMLNADRDRRAGAAANAVQTAAALVDSAMGRKDIDRALLELIRARGNGCNDPRLREHDAALRATLAGQIEAAMCNGRLDQAQPLLDRLHRLDPEGLSTQQLTRAFYQAQSAHSEAAAGNYREAVQVLQRLAVQFPKAGLIRETASHLTNAAESLESVQCGPLGLMTMTSPDDRPAPTPIVKPRQPVAGGLVVGGEALPAKFILQVDGAGSFLIVNKARVTVGPISSSQIPDIALLTEPGAPVVPIERVEDDYFVQQPGTARRLLASGDRISISPRCTLVFSVPNPSSTSAALDLTSGRFPRADVRRIILLDRDLIIGPGSSAHIRSDQLTQPLVLAVRNGQLWCRNEQLAMGRPVNMSGLSFALTIA